MRLASSWPRGQTCLLWNWYPLAFDTQRGRDQVVSFWAVPRYGSITACQEHTETHGASDKKKAQSWPGASDSGARTPISDGRRAGRTYAPPWTPPTRKNYVLRRRDFPGATCCRGRGERELKTLRGLLGRTHSPSLLPTPSTVRCGRRASKSEPNHLVYQGL